jgi:ABC-2 type transport system permease protein
MNLKHSWAIAAKDLGAVRKRKTILYTLILLPLLMSLLFSAIIQYAVNQAGGIAAAASWLRGLLDAFAFFFVIVAAILPSSIASYAIVGEKVEKSLEPLLATPISDGEILLGKSIAAFLPTIIATYAGATIFMTLIDWGSYSYLGYLYYPNWEMGVLLLLLTPLTALLSIEANVIGSARFTDVRAAQSFGSVLFIPFMAIYIAGEIGVITLDTTNLLIISAVFVVLDIVLFFVSTRTFQREEILTKWK